jgi:hypothetical protein
LEEDDSCISLREVRIPERMAMPMLPAVLVSNWWVGIGGVDGC